jgi:hypothetical protein
MKGGRGRHAVIAGVAALVVAGTAVAVLSGGSGSADHVAATVESKQTSPTTRPGTATSEVIEPDPLCVAHETRAAAIGALGAVDNPAERQAFVLAELAFYSDAAGFEPEPDATAFRTLADYFDALRVFFEARGWQNAGLTDIAAVPRPPSGDSATRTSELLAERCGVAPPTDTP